MIVKRADRHDRWVGILALASAVSLIASACASPPPAASNLVPTTSPAPTAAPSPTVTATASRAPAPTPIPTLPSTTKDTTVAPPGAISIKLAREAPRFEPNQVTAKAGTVVFFLQMSPRGSLADHNLAIGPEIHEVLARSSFVQPTKSAVFTVEGLAPGTYTFWCQVPGHAANGMVGTLTITP